MVVPDKWVYLPRYVPILAGIALGGLFGDYPHANDGTRLTRGGRRQLHLADAVAPYTLLPPYALLPWETVQRPTGKAGKKILATFTTLLKGC